MRKEFSLPSQSELPYILIINPGSTSTKIGLYHGRERIFSISLTHSLEILKNFPNTWDQYDFRKEMLLEALQQQSHISRIDIVVGRGGLLKPVKKGVYRINEAMLQDAKRGIQGDHVSNLGCALAQAIASKFKSQALVVDPVSVDEFEPLARYSGHPLVERRALSHALNLRAAAIWAAEKLGVQVSQCNFVVGHLGGGISIAPIMGGRVIDVNDASSDGPFSPERTGGLPLQPFIELCFSGKYSKQDMQKMVMGRGGMIAYLQTSQLQEVEDRISCGDTAASQVLEAMCYQIGKEIGAMATVLKGDIRAIVLTGGLAHSKRITDLIAERTQFIAPIIVMPGELEMEAMAEGALRVWLGIEEIQEYD